MNMVFQSKLMVMKKSSFSSAFNLILKAIVKELEYYMIQHTITLVISYMTVIYVCISQNNILHYLSNGTAMLNFNYQKEMFFVPIVIILKVHDPPHDITNKMTVCPAKTQISLGILHADSEDYDLTGWSESSLGAHASLLVLS